MLVDIIAERYNCKSQQSQHETVIKKSNFIAEEIVSQDRQGV